MNELNHALWGALALASWTVGLFFLRFWRSTGDRLFLFFWLGFWVFALNWGGLVFIHGAEETRHYVYAVRLVAFALIMIGVIDKNRRAAATAGKRSA